jgi:DNA helicase TIP49 (TBP-interacting protein)
MKIKEIEKHQAILGFLAKDKKPFEAYVAKADKKELVFQVDKTIQMSVEVEDYDKTIKAGSTIAIDVETGVVTLVSETGVAPQGELPKSSPRKSCSSHAELRESRGGY